MLDIKFIRDNAKKIKEAAKNKNIKIDIDRLMALDEEKREAQAEIENLRARRNELAESAKGKKPSDEQIEEGKKIKEEISKLEPALEKIDGEYFDLMVKVPTIPATDVPIGK
ncbi:MAG: serine--tRNA ligase, partial [Patescibacteria group bacterium]|nr:serine--tRNA ligase [Patescibacteria group bacterium]